MVGLLSKNLWPYLFQSIRFTNHVPYHTESGCYFRKDDYPIYRGNAAENIAPLKK